MDGSEQVSIPIEGMLRAVQAQRNNALDECAQLHVLVEQVTAERDELRAEVERLRGAGGDGNPLA